MATMEYNGYIAAIEYDGDTDSFFGNVINLSSPVTFLGKTTEALHNEFKISIDTYLDLCKEHGLTPEKPYSGRMTVRIPPSMHKEVATAAAIAGKSINSWVVDSLKRATQEYV